MDLRIIQIDVGRARAAHDELAKQMGIGKFELAIVNQPNKKLAQNCGCGNGCLYNKK